MHLRTHTKRRSLGQAGRWQSPYHDTMLDHDRNVGQLLDLLDQLGIAEDTIVMYGTDNGPHMNTWPDGGDDAVPEREEHELGGRVPRPADRALAGEDPGRRRLQRDRPAPRLAADVPRGRRRAGRRREAEGGPRGGRQDVQGAHRRLQPAPVPDRRGGARARARASSTSRTTATSSRCASTTGSSSSWSSARAARSSCGPSRSSRSACRSSSTCAPTRSSGPT